MNSSVADDFLRVILGKVISGIAGFPFFIFLLLTGVNYFLTPVKSAWTIYLNFWAFLVDIYFWYEVSFLGFDCRIFFKATSF